MRALLLSICVTGVLAASRLTAQTPAPPIIVQAMPQTKPTPAAVATSAAPVAADPVLLKILSEIKADNEAQLAKQAATMQQLDELEKAVEQLKIYSKRG